MRTGAGRSLLLALAAAVSAGAGCESSPSRSTDTPATPPPPSINTGPSVPPSPAPAQPLTVSCRATPNTGDAPLRVDFAASAAGGPGSYEYAWDFGDGGEGSPNPSPAHTYETAGDYEASVTVTDGAQTAACSRSIRVTRDLPAPPALRRLDVVVSGPTPFHVAGPDVTIACANPPLPTDRCSQSFPHGATVRVGAFRTIPAPGPPPVVWSGCDNTFPTNTSWACTVVMDRDRVIVATSF